MSKGVEGRSVSLMYNNSGWTLITSADDMPGYSKLFKPLAKTSMLWREAICIAPFLLATANKGSVVCECVPRKSLHHNIILRAYLLSKQRLSSLQQGRLANYHNRDKQYIGLFRNRLPMDNLTKSATITA